MNAARRKALEGILDQLEAAKSATETVASEEREAFDSMPEGLQQGERGQQVEENADALEAIDGDFDSLMDAIREVIEK